MRVNEIRTNSVVTKSSTKANYANKQAFSALPYVSKTTSRVFTIGQAFYKVAEFFEKFNPFVKSKKLNATEFEFKRLNPEIDKEKLESLNEFGRGVSKILKAEEEAKERIAKEKLESLNEFGRGVSKILKVEGN